MEDKTAAVIKKLKALSSNQAGDQNAALTSFLINLEDIIGTHSIRVAGYAAITGREMALPEKEAASLYTSALLHDIGKLFIPAGILHKTDSLNDYEIEIIRRHPITGRDILREIGGYKQFADTVLYHHEFYNGRGYPGGLCGDKIPLLSRIITVADAYEAMTSERPYRKGFSHREAVNRLRYGRLTQFDPEITDAFLKAIRKHSNSDLLYSQAKVEI